MDLLRGSVEELCVPAAGFVGRAREEDRLRECVVTVFPNRKQLFLSVGERRNIARILDEKVPRGEKYIRIIRSFVSIDRSCFLQVAFIFP